MANSVDNTERRIEKPSKRRAALFYLTVIVTILCAAVHSFTAAASTLYGDDFNYALYFRDGLRNFRDLTVSHYLNINGRAIVHLLLELVLIPKDRLFFAVIPLMIFAVYFFAARAVRAENRLLFLALGLSGTLFLPWTVFREGVFWMSGAVNYIYPTVMVFAAFYLYRRTVEDRISVLTIPVMFLAGASTEQGGAAAIIAALLFTLARVRDRKKLLGCGVMLFFLAVGYATVMLSPATSGRAAAEVSEKLGMIDRLKNVYEYSVGKDSAFLVFEGTLALLAADGFRRNKLFPALLGSAAVAAVILWALGRYTATGLVLTVALVCAGLYGLFSGKAERSALLLAGLASVGMLVFSVTFGYRNILPGLLILIAVSADVLCGVSEPKRIAVVSVVFTLGMVSFLPVLSGYAANRKIINENLSALGNGTEDFYYNIDLDPKYSYNQFVSDGNGYRAAYREVYGVRDGVKIFIRGNDFRDLYRNGVHCENPVYTVNGADYYPFRNMIEAEDGSVTYNSAEKVTEIELHGKTFVFDNRKNTVTADGIVTDVSGYRLFDRKYGNMSSATLYFAKEFYTDVLGIQVENQEKGEKKNAHTDNERSEP